MATLVRCVGVAAVVAVVAGFEVDDVVAVENAWKKAVEQEPTMPPPFLSPAVVSVISTISAVSVVHCSVLLVCARQRSSRLACSSHVHQLSLCTCLCP
jgi:hypothetical protein